MEISIRIKDKETPMRFVIDDTGPEADVHVFAEVKYKCESGIRTEEMYLGETTVKELRHVGRALAAL